MSTVDDFLSSLRRPIVLTHLDSDRAGFPDEDRILLYQHLLDWFDGTIVALDDDLQRHKPSCRTRWRHTGEWGFHPTHEEVLDLIRKSDLLIAVESDVLTAANSTDTPTIGVWASGRRPEHLIQPRPTLANLCSSEERSLNCQHRIRHNIIEGDGGVHVATHASRMLQGPMYTPGAQVARDVQLQQFVGWCRSRFRGEEDLLVDRHRSFAASLERLRSIAESLTSGERLTIVETGCCWAAEDWGGAGFATYLLGAFAMAWGGIMHSVELDPEHVAVGRDCIAELNGTVTIHQSHSYEYLDAFDEPIDLFYGDSADVWTSVAAECCITEVQKAVPKLRSRDSLILIDDSDFRREGWVGKGRLAIPWLLDRGWRIVYAGHQVLLEQA